MGIDSPSGNKIELTGVCVRRDCGGTDDAEMFKKGKKPKEESAKTERVTICHRTCSPTNPWVRITIDNDAWQKGDEHCGEGNGHRPYVGGTGGGELGDQGNKGHKVTD